MPPPTLSRTAAPRAGGCRVDRALPPRTPARAPDPAAPAGGSTSTPQPRRPTWRQTGRPRSTSRRAAALMVKAILGDMLGQNYTIAPGVQGTVTWPRRARHPRRPTCCSSALPTTTRMVYSGGMYQIVPADPAGLRRRGTARRSAAARGFEVGGAAAPHLGQRNGEGARAVRPAIVAVDNGRNTSSTVAGELSTCARSTSTWTGLGMSACSRPAGKATRVAATGEGVRRAEQDPGRGHVPLHAAGLTRCW